MAYQEELDDLSKFEAKDTARKLPVGWVLLFWGLVAWGVYYLWTYSPALGGWSQARELDTAGASAGTNVLATVLFTAIATLVAVVLVLSQRRKR